MFGGDKEESSATKMFVVVSNCLSHMCHALNNLEHIFRANSFFFSFPLPYSLVFSCVPKG